MPLITLLRAELAFGTQPLLDRADFSIDANERIGLIGRNGTGKSSLLGAILGRTPLDDGDIQQPAGLRIASVEQEPDLPAAVTLREAAALRIGLENVEDERARWRAEARLVEYLHRFGLDGTLSPANLSGGERKRAALAAAMALDPQLLLLDEPTAGMNSSEAQSLMALFKELIGKYVKAILLIEHNMRVVMGISDRVHVLDYGEKISEGHPDEVRRDPRVIEAYLGQGSWVENAQS